MLLDIRIPEPSGLEVLDAVRREDRPVKVVMFSAHADAETEKEAMRRGADGFVVKPFTAASLCSLIEEILEVETP